MCAMGCVLWVQEYVKCMGDAAYFVSRYIHIYNATAQSWMLLQPWPAQGDVLQTMQRERLLIILKARQLGLSWLACAYALWLLTFGPPATVLLFSQRAVEAEELLARIRQMYGYLPLWLQAPAIQRDKGQAFELSSGSRALAFSTRGGRSYTGTLAIIDEADHVPDLSAFLNAVKPTVDAGGKLFLISTADKSRPVSTFKNLFRAASTQHKGYSPQKPGGSEGLPQRPQDTEISGTLPTATPTDRNDQTRVGGESAVESLTIEEENQKSQMGYFPIFLPWWVRPGRDEAWAARTRAEMYAQRGTDDDWFAEYPATPEEALAPEQLDRRIPFAWLQNCLDIQEPLALEDRDNEKIENSHNTLFPTSYTLFPALPGLRIYVPPTPNRHYVIGADPAEGNPNSDESAATVLDATSWEQVAVLALRVEPATFAHYLDQLASWYQNADVMVERNNHGHTVIAGLRETGRVRVLPGLDGKPGWLSNVKGKPILYAALAEAIHDQATVIRDRETANQLAAIEASTLRAAAGLHDDRADAFALAIVALRYGKVGAVASTAVAPAEDFGF